MKFMDSEVALGGHLWKTGIKAPGRRSQGIQETVRDCRPQEDDHGDRGPKFRSQLKHQRAAETAPLATSECDPGFGLTTDSPIRSQRCCLYPDSHQAGCLRKPDRKLSVQVAKEVPILKPS